MSTITQGFLDHKIFGIVSEVAAEKGVRAFVIGGYVRDCFLGRQSKDIDICLSLRKLMILTSSSYYSDIVTR